MSALIGTLAGMLGRLLRRLNGETVRPENDDDPMGDKVWARDQLTIDAGFNHGSESMGDGGLPGV